MDASSLIDPWVAKDVAQTLTILGLLARQLFMIRKYRNGHKPVTQDVYELLAAAQEKRLAAMEDNIARLRDGIHDVRDKHMLGLMREIRELDLRIQHLEDAHNG